MYSVPYEQRVRWGGGGNVERNTTAIHGTPFVVLYVDRVFAVLRVEPWQARNPGRTERGVT